MFNDKILAIDMSKEQFMVMQEARNEIMKAFFIPSKKLDSKQDVIEHFAEMAVELYEFERGLDEKNI